MTVTVRTNLCYNPSFEATTNGWQTSNTTLSRITTDPFVGIASAQAVATSTSLSSALRFGNVSPSVFASPGEVFTASCYVKNTAGATRNHRVGITWINAAGGSISISFGIAVSVTAGGSYQRITHTATAPANAARLRIDIQYQANNAALGNTTLIDAVLIEKSSTLNSYFDGNTADSTYETYAWTGTANNSTSTFTYAHTGKYPWTISVCPDFDDVYVELASVQSIQMTYGRRLATDSLKGSTITVTGRNPELLPTLVQGVYALLETTGFSYQCYLADIQIDYGIIPAEDTWTIVFEDALGVAGKVSKTVSITTNQRSAQAMSNLAATNEPRPSVFIGNTDLNGVARISAVSITNGNLLEAFNQVMNTEQGLLYGGFPSGAAFGNKELYFRNRGRREGPEAEFTDTTPQVAAIEATFDRVAFAGLQQTYWDKVTVEPEGLAAQTAGTGIVAYVVSTYDVSTVQAADTAQYILDNSSPATNGPIELSCLAEAQTTDAALDVAQVGRVINIKLRGNEYTCEVLGGAIGITPASTRFSYYLKLLEGSSFNFTLDSTYYGVLDQDRLG